MALTLTSKIAASKTSTTITNATSTFALGDMAGDEMHQSIYLSVGAVDVTLTAATPETTDIGLGSIDIAKNHWLLLRNVEASAGTWAVSMDGGTTDHFHIPVGGVWGPCLIEGGVYVTICPSAAGDRLEIVACEGEA